METSSTTDSTNLYPPPKFTVDLQELRKALEMKEKIWVTAIGANVSPVREQTIAEFERVWPNSGIGKNLRRMNALSRMVREKIDAEEKRASEEVARLGNQLLTELFGQTVPGEVTLPKEYGGEVSFRVTGISSLFKCEDGRLSGYIHTTRHNGSVHDTERFYVDRYGKVVIAEPDLY